MCTLLMDTLQALHATRHYHPTWIALSHLNPLHHSNGPIFRSCIYTNLIHCCEITVCPSDRYRSFSCLAYLSEPKTRQLAFVCLLAVSKSAYRCSRSPSSFDMAPTTPQLAFRQSGWKVVAYSSSPSEKQYKVSVLHPTTPVSRNIYLQTLYAKCWHTSAQHLLLMRTCLCTSVCVLPRTNRMLWFGSILQASKSAILDSFFSPLFAGCAKPVHSV